MEIIGNDWYLTWRRPNVVNLWDE